MDLNPAFPVSRLRAGSIIDKTLSNSILIFLLHKNNKILLYIRKYIVLETNTEIKNGLKLKGGMVYNPSVPKEEGERGEDGSQR